MILQMLAPTNKTVKGKFRKNSDIKSDKLKKSENDTWGQENVGDMGISKVDTKSFIIYNLKNV